MARQTTRSDLSLKWLELFQICAHKGSLQSAAEETGLSISTVSHHMRKLEDHLGVELFNHNRRPMILTPKGHMFLRNIDDALRSIRKAQAEASAGNISEASYLRIGAIGDFDSDISPELAVYLSEQMPRCDFQFQTDTSASIIQQLRDRQLDLGVTATSPERLQDLHDIPLLKDPFVVVLPINSEQLLDEIMEGTVKLPFMRFSGNLLISRQIEAQLRRMNLTPPRRFECGNNQTMMAMVAAGSGWTITTPLLFARAKRFQPRLRMHPFPGKSFSRSLSLVSTPDCASTVVNLANRKLRDLLTEHAIKPLRASSPWLKESFHLLT